MRIAVEMDIDLILIITTLESCFSFSHILAHNTVAAHGELAAGAGVVVGLITVIADLVTGFAFSDIGADDTVSTEGL